jgi:hypothetical protein
MPPPIIAAENAQVKLVCAVISWTVDSRIPLKMLIDSPTKCVSLSLIRTDQLDPVDASLSRDIADQYKKRNSLCPAHESTVLVHTAAIKQQLKMSRAVHDSKVGIV